MLGVLTIDRVREAAQRVYGSAGHPSSVVKTPLLKHQTPTGRTLWLKAESLQPIGAFKIRGATNLIRSLPQDVRGVVAHSSGNHAQAVARAAREAGLPAVIVMPNDAPEIKRRRTELDGAEIVEVGPDSLERAQKADEIAAERRWALVPPFDHPDIAAGQGTAALEIVEALGSEPIERFYCPTSGGGLMSGCATVLHALRPNIECIGVEPDTAQDTALSLAAGHRVSIPVSPTIADGLRQRIPGELTFEVLKARLNRVQLVSETQLLDAIAYAARYLRLVLEPSGAAGLAAALHEEADRSVVILTGGNVDVAVFQEALQRPNSIWENHNSNITVTAPPSLDRHLDFEQGQTG